MSVAGLSVGEGVLRLGSCVADELGEIGAGGDCEGGVGVALLGGLSGDFGRIGRGGTCEGGGRGGGAPWRQVGVRGWLVVGVVTVGIG